MQRNFHFYLNRLVLLGLSCAFLLPAKAQTYYNQLPEYLKANSQWALSTGALDFNTTPPTVVEGGGTYEGIASVADPVSGALLFYSNGIECRDANHQVMPNGSMLLGNAGVGGQGPSTTQGVCIVPFIGQRGKYYLFSLNGPTGWSLSPQPDTFLYYSVIDMSLNGGRGDIVAGQKNIPLGGKMPLSESMIAIPGDNCDVWLMTHDYIDPVFRAYHITQQGIDAQAVVSTAGTQIQGNNSMGAYYGGGMAISPDRKLLAITSCVLGFGSTAGISGALVCPFDPASGKVSNGIQLNQTGMMSYTLAFSPDNSKLYLCAFMDSALSALNTPCPVLQYDVSRLDSATIAASEVIVGATRQDYNASGYFKLYNDKIYLMPFISTDSLFVINQPNLPGLACNYSSCAYLNPKGLSFGGPSLPADVVYALPADTIRSLLLDTFACTRQISIEGPANQKEYTWEDGSKGATRIVAVPGKYWLKSTGSCHTRIDTFLISAGIEKPIIRVDQFDLSTTTAYTSYQWLYNGTVIPGATSEKYTVTQNGDYQVIVGNANGCRDTSDAYPVNNVSVKIPGNHGLLRIYPNPANDNLYLQSPAPLNIALYDASGRLCLRAEQTKIISVRQLAGGLYTIVLSDDQGNLLQRDRVTIVRD